MERQLRPVNLGNAVESWLLAVLTATSGSSGNRDKTGGEEGWSVWEVW